MHTYTRYVYLQYTCTCNAHRLTKTDFSVKGLKYMAEMIPKNKKLEVIRLAMLRTMIYTILTIIKNVLLIL
jgi:hypothetical protein